MHDPFRRDLRRLLEDARPDVVHIVVNREKQCIMVSRGKQTESLPPEVEQLHTGGQEATKVNETA